jgi:hypothetical protein
MSKPAPNPTRLSGLPETDDPLGLGRMFRDARALPDEDLPTLRWRLRTSLQLRAVRPRLFLKVALVVGVVFCTGGVVGAVVSPYLARKQPVVVEAPAVAPTARHRKPRSVTAAPATPALPLPLPAETEAAAREPTSVELKPAASVPAPLPDGPKPVSAAAKTPAPVRVAVLNEPGPTPGQPPAMAPPATAPSRIAAEQALLGQAMKTLRNGRDAQTALALLAQHAERFPDGALASEATMLRIEALLDLGRREEALAVLDGVPLASLPNRDEQLVVRGELRAVSGRWLAAMQDFDDALGGRSLPAASGKARSIQERALWGRAAARSRLGDLAGTRADLELYLRHFPGGRFAVPAASLLRGVP